MMSLYALNATLTIPGQTAVGKEQIRRFWLTKWKRSGRAIGGSRRHRRTRCG